MNDRYALNTITLEASALKYDLDIALKYLKDDLVVRDTGIEFRQLLKDKQADEKALKKRFGAQNFYNWLNGNSFISRSKAIELCFALNLDIDDAELFLQKICGHNWFHLRDYEDAIYYFCLLNGLSYDKATEIIKKYEKLKVINPTNQQDISFTHYIKQDLVDLNSTEEDLYEYLDKNQDKFGSFNNTAYNYFKLFFDKVKNDEEKIRRNEIKRKEDDGEKEKYIRAEISFSDICEKMRISIPSDLTVGCLTQLQRSIYEDAPNRPTLTDIYNKKEVNNGKIRQVTRKTLIIIWMMANESKEFISRVKIINGILDNCGMPKLDSKNPFDWIVLNALESDGIVRMEEIIQNIFNINTVDTGI